MVFGVGSLVSESHSGTKTVVVEIVNKHWFNCGECRVLESVAGLCL